MARPKKTPSDPSTPPPIKLPPRAICDAIVRRFLKENQNIDWRREMPKFFQLFKRYPSLDFWQKHEPPFGLHRLNHMSWFESVEGQAHLDSAFPLFHYNPPDPTVTPPSQLSTLDNLPQTSDNGGVSETVTPPLPPPSYPDRPRTVADMLRDI